jgi:hypothetical protein
MHRKHHAIGSARARRSLALIKHHCQFTRLGTQARHRVFTNADADGQTGAKSPMHATKQPDPFLGRFAARGSAGGQNS